ncbi:MAG: hypothetical protein ABSE04_02795 [Candidatus Microgenomates bacterium]|jgi:ATP-dependent Zn protease
MPVSKKEELCAYHEAGHAVLAVILGMPVESVSMKDRVTKYKVEGKIRDSILVSLAGAFAAQHIDKMGLTAADDLYKAKRLLIEGENIESFEREAKRLVKKHKKIIHAVALELLSKNCLTGEEVKRIVDIHFLPQQT